MQNTPYADIQSINHSYSSIQRFSTTHPTFVCIISYTETSQVPGITAAGARPDLVKHTSAADAEYLCYGYCKTISDVPATPDGKPTPAIISRSALQLADIPFLIIDAGSKIKPCIPYLSFGLEPGKNIMYGKAMNVEEVKKAFGYGFMMGKQLAKNSDLLAIGESIPAGTTTALGVLLSLGIDAKFKVSSSMPRNPHNLKNRIVAEGMDKAEIYFGKFKNDPFNAISFMGDPMMPVAAGLADGVMSIGRNVMLAGGTQMCAVAAILKSLKRSLSRLCIGTTSYVTNDQSSDILHLIKSISDDIPIYVSDLHMKDSSRKGLQAFAKGHVKDGVGAGGASITSMMKSRGRVNGSILLKAIEEEYKVSVEKNYD